MDSNLGTVDLASLAPPLQALFAGQQATIEALRAENAALSDHTAGSKSEAPRALSRTCAPRSRR